MSAPLPVRIAVVGVGHLGRHHARLAASLAGIRLVGVHDHHEGRADAVAGEFGTSVLRDLDAVADEAEAVIVATPTSTHAAIARELLARGKDVLVEKPIASSLPEADEMLSAAERGERILHVGHVERYNPALEAAMAMGAEPLFLEIHRLGIFSARGLDVDVVLDLMIHDLQIVRALVGRRPTEIRAAGVPVLTPRVDIANARIAFEGGCVANLTASRVSAEKVRRCRIFARSLYLSIDLHSQAVRAFRLSRDGGSPEIVPLDVSVRREEPLAREIADFARSVRERTPPLVSGREGREALALATQVVEAIDRHRREAGGGEP